MNSAIINAAASSYSAAYTLKAEHLFSSNNTIADPHEYCKEVFNWCASVNTHKDFYLAIPKIIHEALIVFTKACKEKKDIDVDSLVIDFIDELDLMSYCTNGESEHEQLMNQLIFVDLFDFCADYAALNSSQRVIDLLASKKGKSHKDALFFICMCVSTLLGEEIIDESDSSSNKHLGEIIDKIINAVGIKNTLLFFSDTLTIDIDGDTGVFKYILKREECVNFFDERVESIAVLEKILMQNEKLCRYLIDTGLLSKYKSTNFLLTQNYRETKIFQQSYFSSSNRQTLRNVFSHFINTKSLTVHHINASIVLGSEIFALNKKDNAVIEQVFKSHEPTQFFNKQEYQAKNYLSLIKLSNTVQQGLSHEQAQCWQAPFLSSLSSYLQDDDVRGAEAAILLRHLNLYNLISPAQCQAVSAGEYLTYCARAVKKLVSCGIHLRTVAPMEYCQIEHNIFNESKYRVFTKKESALALSRAVENLVKECAKAPPTHPMKDRIDSIAVRVQKLLLDNSIMHKSDKHSQKLKI